MFYSGEAMDTTRRTSRTWEERMAARPGFELRALRAIAALLSALAIGIMIGSRFPVF